MHSSVSKKIFKAKKYMASKLSESNTGRLAVMKLLGQEGEIIIKAMKSATQKISGENQAGALNKDIIKLLSKCYILNKNNMLREEDFASSKDILNNLLFKIISNLQSAVSRDDLELSELQRLASDSHNALLQIIQPLMKQENWIRLTRIFDYYSSEQFICALLYNHEIQIEKNAITHQLKMAIQPFEQSEQMSKKGIQILSLRREILEQMIKHPDLNDYLLNPEGTTVFNDWLVEEDGKFGESVGILPSNYLTFYQVVMSFRQITSRSILHARIQGIFDKFINRNGPLHVHLPENILCDIELAIDEGRLTKTIFDHAMNETFRILLEEYFPRFIQSDKIEILRNSLHDVQNKLEVTQTRRRDSLMIDRMVDLKSDLNDESDEEVFEESDDENEETKK